MFEIAFELPPWIPEYIPKTQVKECIQDRLLFFNVIAYNASVL